MAKEIAIGIRITTTGTDKVIRNLGELENELARLNTEIKTLDFGSPQFIEAQKNIQILKSRIDDFDKATEGLGAEKNFNALSASIGVLTGSFQVLSGAVGLFISDEEDLVAVQKAEQQALGVLNLALGINTINKELVESRTKRAALAEKAYTIATNVATKAQKLFNAALASNPIALVIAGIVALGAAIYGLIKVYQNFFSAEAKQEKQAKALIAAEGELLESRMKAGQELKQQLKILTDNISSRNLERKTLEDLKKAYPGFNAFIDKNNRLTQEGIGFLKTKIKLMEAEAVLQAIIEKRSAAEVKLAQENNKLESEGVGVGSQLLALLTGRNALLDAYVSNAEEYADATRGLNELEEKYTNIIDEATGELDVYNKKLDAQAKAEGRAADAAKRQLQVLDDYTLSLQQRNQALEQYLSLLGEVSGAALEADTQILEDQQDILDRQKEFLKTLSDATKPEREKFLQEQRDLLFAIIPTDAEEKELQDKFYDLFVGIRGTIGLGFGAAAKDFNQLLDSYASEIAYITTSNLRVAGLPFDLEAEKKKITDVFNNLDDETKQLFTDYFGGIAERAQAIAGIVNSFGGEAVANNQQLLDLETQIAQSRARQAKEGRTDFAQKQLELKIIESELGLTIQRAQYITELIEEQKKLTAAEKTGNEKQINISKARIEQLSKFIENYDKILLAVQSNIDKSADFAIAVEGVNEKFREQEEQINQNKTAIENYLDPATLLNYFENLGEGYNFILEDLNTNLDKYLERFGAEGVMAIYKGIETGVSAIEFQTREEVQRYITLLEDVGGKISTALKLGGNPFQPLIDQLRGTLRALPKEVAGIQKFLTEAIVDGLSRKDIADQVLAAYGDISGRLTNIISQNNSLLLEQLSFQQEQALAEIGEANTENAKQNERILAERELVEKAYAKKRFEIEKKARITELKFSVGQAIADASQAALNALANIPAPFGAIYAAGLAGLTAFQVKQIQAQLSFAQSQQFVGRRGGAVMGGSHEQGGVPALLEGGEFILNKEAVSAFSNEIQSINNATGGRPMAIDDSRLVQAIASQNLDKKQPIKTYVLYQDIKDTEKLNSKISQLSKL